MMIWQRVSSPLGAVSLPVSVLSQAGMAKYYRIRHFRYRWTTDDFESRLGTAETYIKEKCPH